MDKPISMSVKDWIIRKISTEKMVKESIIEEVVDYQFRKAKEALMKCNSLEISGFGKFYFMEGKARKYLKELERVLEAYRKDYALPQEQWTKKGMVWRIPILEARIEDLRRRIENVKSS